MEGKIDLRWRKSSYSGNGGGNCVEVADQAARARPGRTPYGTGGGGRGGFGGGGGGSGVGGRELDDGDGEGARAADLAGGPGDSRGIGQLKVGVAGHPFLQGDPEFHPG